MAEAESKGLRAKRFIAESVTIAVMLSVGAIAASLGRGDPVTVSIAGVALAVAFVLVVRLLAFPVRSALHRYADRVEPRRPKLAARLRRIR